MNELLVSISCITYNHAPYIRQCLDSIIMQKTNFPFEILIHDDASTDGTADIIREYEGKYHDIIKPIYQKENQYSKEIPISRTYNFPRAKGKYIALCEGDDYWTDPYKLQKQVDYLEKNDDISFCFHNAIVYYVDTGISEPFNIELTSKTYKTKDILLKKWFIPTASIVFRSRLVENLFPKWSKNVYNGDLCLELLLSTKGDFFYLNETMSVYRKNAPNSLSINGPIGVAFLRKLLFLLTNFRKHTFPKNFFDSSCAILIVRLKLFYMHFPVLMNLKRKFSIGNRLNK